MRLVLLSLRQRAEDSLWLVPALGVVAAVALALLLVEVDSDAPDAVGRFALFAGGPDASRTLLSTIAAATIGATTLVFSITMLVLQLASGQFSPRVLRTYLKDPYAKYTLGIFVATFAFALAVLAHTDGAIDDESPPTFALSITVAFILVLLSVAALVTYIHHTAQSIRVANIIVSITDDALRAINRLYPSNAGDEDDTATAATPEAGRVVPSRQSGVVTAVDHERLMELAVREGVTIAVERRIGDFVAAGATLAAVSGAAAGRDDLDDAVGACVLLGPERTVEQDAAFGFRQLVDIASRALSPGTNDPTTAVQSLDRVYALLLNLSERSIPSPLRLDDQGALRLVLPRPAWEDYVHLAFDEVIEYGVSSSQVRERLYQMFDALEASVPPYRRDAIRLHRRELDALAADVPLAHARA